MVEYREGEIPLREIFGQLFELCVLLDVHGDQGKKL